MENYPMERKRLERTLANLRFMSTVAVVASSLGALLMFLIGAVKVVRAYQSFFSTTPIFGTAPLTGADVSIASLIQAIDAFLIALGFLIFAGGIYNISVHPVSDEHPGTRALFQIRNISELKSILAELIIIILMVKFLETALMSLGAYKWEMLILPVSILMLALGTRFLKLKG
jgi:uncharacterized membrane protein YqhA